MRVAIIGAGYVGLVTGACLADKGHQVRCVDIDAQRVEQINAAQPPIHEDGLPELLARTVGETLDATTDLATAVDWSDVTMLAVGTPLGADGQIDLQYVTAAAEQIGATLRDRDSDRYHVTIVKSTVVPGTTSTVVVPALESASGRVAGIDFGVGVNPEFLTEGTAVADFMAPDRIVIGGIDDRAIEAIEQLYTAFPDAPRVRTNPSTAELIKYTSNALLATMISFSNEIGNLASALGDIDVAEVTDGMHQSMYLSPRLDDGTRVRAPISSFLEAGCGFGGSCLPKDVGALIAHGERAGTPMRLLRSVLKINAGQPERLVALTCDGLGGLEDRTVAVLGLAFKPDTDDLRESPAFPVIDGLLEAGATVIAHDPIAIPAARERLQDRVTLTEDLDAAVADADAVVIVTRWDCYHDVPKLIADLDPQPLVVDGRRMLDREATSRYAGIGLGAALT
ncbi:UDP-glucose/GDP-mannose dehydrogenase family protein [soil metagenome]